jgi:hypothetical protein
MSQNLKKRLLCGVACLVVFGEPANAYDIVSDPIVEAQTTAMHAWQQIQDALKELQTSWAVAITEAGTYLQTKIAVMNTDTASANARTNVDVATAQEIAVQNDMPTAYSPCRIAQSAAASSELLKINAAVAQALSNGGASRPTDPSAHAKDIRAGLESGLAPCIGDKQTESSIGKALGCTARWGGRWERADLTPAAIFSYLQFPVPPNFSLPTNGVYQQVPIPTQEKYMPFVAALRFCQRITSRIPPAPQAVNGKLPQDVLMIDAYGDMQAASGMAYDTCMSLLSERMQYGQNVSPAYRDAFILQKAGCVADAAIGYIDGDPKYTFVDGTTGTCSTDGRSELQAMHDKAFRNATLSYHAVFTVGLDRQSIGRENASLPIEQRAFNEHIMEERKLLSAAIEQANDAIKIYTNVAVSQPVKQ